MFWSSLLEINDSRHNRSTGVTYLYSPVVLFLSLAIPPIACFALRGTAKEFIIKFFLTETPSIKGSVWNASPLVSWKRHNHLMPLSFHFRATPCLCSKLWMSPCPCGLVSKIEGSPGVKHILASLSSKAGTPSPCCTITICDGFIPK